MDLNHAAREHAELLTCSGSERWMACPGSAKLGAMYPRTDTVFTKEGTAAHEIAEVSARRLVLGEASEMPQGEQYDADMLRHGQAYAEYVHGLCGPNSEVLLEQRVDVSEWVPGCFGTADCIILTGDRMDVIDFKYGQGVAVSSVRNTQMMLYGLGAMSEYGFLYEVKNVRLHIFQPRIDNISMFELSVEELLEFGRIATGKAWECLEENPELYAGPHCKFCPHAGKCPELAQTCIKKVTIGDTVAPDPKTMSPAAVAYVLGIEPMITAWLNSVSSAALTSAINGEDIPGYKVVAGKLGNRAWTDELQVIQALDAAGIAREDYTEVKVKSPTRMDDVLGKKKAEKLLGEYIKRKPGSPLLVPLSDKRPKLDRVAQAQDDFKD